MAAVVSSLTPATSAINSTTTTTADDTLKQKTRNAGVISGGRLVARALKNEGVDTIFTLCGGRFGAPHLAVIGNNSAMNQIRYGQLAKYGEERDNVGNLLSDVPFSKFAEMLGGHGEKCATPRR